MIMLPIQLLIRQTAELYGKLWTVSNVCPPNNFKTGRYFDKSLLHHRTQSSMSPIPSFRPHQASPPKSTPPPSSIPIQQVHTLLPPPHPTPQNHVIQSQ